MGMIAFVVLMTQQAMASYGRGSCPSVQTATVTEADLTGLWYEQERDEQVMWEDGHECST